MLGYDLLFAAISSCSVFKNSAPVVHSTHFRVSIYQYQLYRHHTSSVPLKAETVA